MQTPIGPKRPRFGLGPEFLKLWAASAVSNVGDGVTAVAAPLLAASLTRDPLLVAGLAFAVQLPWLLFSLVSGAIVDRLDRRMVMGAVAAFRSALIGVLGLAVLADAASMPLLYCVFFLLGAAETVFDPASVTVLPTIVPREGLPKANARLAGTSTVLNVFVGPPLGGFLFAAAAALPFLLAGASFAAACALVLALRGTFRVERAEGAPPTRLRGEIAEGVRWLARHRLLRVMAMALGLMNLTMAAWNSILVLFATERLGLGPRGFGLLLSAYALGGTAASAVAQQVITRLGPGRTLRIGLLIEAGTAMVLARTGEPFVAGAVLALFGFHAIVWGTLTISLRQELIPPALLGRVNSAYDMIGKGTSALGVVVGGLLAANFGLVSPFWFAAFGMALLTLVVWPVFRDSTIVGARRNAAERAA